MESTKVIQLYKDITLNDAEDVSITVDNNEINAGEKLNASDNKSVNIRLYDFGGHREYQFITPIFCKKRSVCLLVFNGENYDHTAIHYSKEVGQWIESLASAQFEGTVILIANQKKERKYGPFIGVEIKEIEAKLLATVKKHLTERWRQLKPHKIINEPYLVNKVYTISSDISGFFSIMKAVVNDPVLFPTQAVYPANWKELKEKMTNNATKGYLLKKNVLPLFKEIDDKA